MVGSNPTSRTRMKILSIETSCDETAVSIVDAEGGLTSPHFKILGNALFSQIEIHKEYGGVFPMLAKREHSKRLPMLLEKTLKEAEMYELSDTKNNPDIWMDIKNILIKEDGLFEDFKKKFENIGAPKIDVISVTSGPGLEPALWVGISFATALGELWGIPVVPANHMEGHIASVLMSEKREIIFPALALLISGGHTEIVKIEDWGKYEIIGETLDDAVGEAFDKVARMLYLPYPGGPEISKLAQKARQENLPHTAKLPRPMIHSHNLNFSFSGLKTAVLYYIRDNFKDKVLSQDDKADIAREFEDCVVDILTIKIKEAIDETSAKTLIIAGGVIANKKLRETFTKMEEEYSELKVLIPTNELSTDNALMIACASYININLYPEIIKRREKIIAKGNLRLKSLS